MPRPKKWRKIEFLPEYTVFKPAGIPKKDLDTIQLQVEELEAMRLKDIVGLNQAECAEKMSVSRQTFQLIIDSARNKVALALTEGKGIIIGGGNYTVKLCHYKCIDCNENFTLNYEGDRICPNCSSSNIRCVKDDEFCKKNCCQMNEEKQ